MLKAVLVDDEKPALRLLEIMLSDFKDISVIGSFTNPREATEKISLWKPDVVFLDINMPQLKGIDIASQILVELPETSIVFVTGYEEYAIEAFELNALDYLLKPFEPERLEKAVMRVIKAKSTEQLIRGQRLQIRCLGQFAVSWENEEPIKWRAEKTKELIAFLLHNLSRKISKEELLDVLWPEGDPDKSIRQLYNGIYYIRKTLKEYGVDKDLIFVDNNYRVKLGDVDYDIDYFNEIYDSIETVSIDSLKRTEKLYTGDYLSGEYYEWAFDERDRLSRNYQNLIIRLSEKLIADEFWSDAEKYLILGFNKNPYDERFTELLLKTYIGSGNIYQARLHYNNYCGILKDELDTGPSRKIIETLNAIK